MNITRKIISLVLAMLMILAVMPAAVAENEYVQPALGARVKEIIEVDGYQFKDLNANGELDPYEDWRLSAEERADDLLSKMDASQKAAQMIHLTLTSKRDSWYSSDNVGFALVYEYIFDEASEAARRTNEIQELSESSALGIPIIFSMDTEIGAAFVKSATFLPDEINQGAANDAELVYQLNDLLREELLAVGVRMALSPDADLITDPRWGRNQECYSEDTEVVQTLIVAAVEALQVGNTLGNESVIACVKHFPGSGAQTDGVDGTPLTIQADSIELHLAGFKAAIAAGVASVMPYGYSTVPYLGGDAVENSADQSSVVMTDLLRNELGFEGIIQTDWGLNFVGAANAGADAIGGAGVRAIRQLVDGVDEQKITDACRRILIAKFQLGIFENPYVDEAAAAEIVGSAENKALAKEAAQRSFTLVKYENVQALGETIIVAGALADNVRALNSGWTAKAPVELVGDSILQAFKNRLGEENVTYYATAEEVPSDLTGKTVIVVIGERDGTHEPAWGSSNLEFPEDQVALVKALDAAGANVVSVVLMNRAYVMTEMVELSDVVLLAYKPGVTMGAEALVDTLYGEAAITGRLPFQIPRTMDQVLAQREDLPKDIVDPLFEYGFGIDVESFGK
nr:glycoside hydrolase family 3 protein [Clostridia bacterium]